MIGYVFVFMMLIFFLVGIRIVRPDSVALIETFGKYSRTATQGFNWIIPVIQRALYVNMTERMVDVPPQKIITKDDLNADVDAVVYFKINDPTNAAYKVYSYQKQISSLSRTTLRNIIGTMSLSDANSKREEINGQLETELDKQTDAWGIDIVRVEIQRIEPPSDVQEAMNQVVKAEREKLAAKDFANAVETKADGERRAEIKKAEGVKQGRILQAEGKAQAIKLENEAAQKYFTGNAIELKRLEVMQNSLKDNAKIVLTEKGLSPNLFIGDIPLKKRDKT